MFNDEHNKKHAKLLMAGLLGLAAVNSVVMRGKTKAGKNHRANKKLKEKRKSSRRA